MSEPSSDAVAGRTPASIVRALQNGQRVLDREFDTLYPESLRQFSAHYWTPVEVARCAAALLIAGGASRVLDVGAGVGKFCMIGALTTGPGATFCGIEHRKHLVEVGLEVLRDCEVSGVELRHAVLEEEIARQDFDAFYLFNPFEENLVRRKEQIDQSVALSTERFERDVERMEGILRGASVGARVVTYHGFGGWIPASYALVGQKQCGTCQLHLWVKTRESRPGDDVLYDGRL